ncbi:MAG: NACHT domain-containing protein, partial [Deltaproteobacteria bacterium]|nr:NACHT domain-containing protein [Deltaproteobacteria bacterium]
AGGRRGDKGAGELHQGPSALYKALANPRLVIIGDPGAGKTTFLRWVAHTMAADRLGKKAGAARTILGLERARLPLLLPIAEWLDYRDRLSARNQGPALASAAQWLPEYLGSSAQAGNQGLTRDDFLQPLKDGDALILLDGLDEAPDPSRRAQAVKLIEALARAYPDCPLVVTSRPAAYRDKAVLNGFSHTTIEALDPDAIHTFLSRWSQALYPQQPGKAEAHRQALRSALEARREIRRMARNTVMLTALAVVHWNEKRLPEQRAELYESIIKWLSEAREQRPGRLPAQRCRQLLGELALAMQLGAGPGDGNGQGGRVVQLPRHQGAEWIAPQVAAIPAPADVQSGAGQVERAEAFLAEEELDSGILVR